MGDGEDMVTVMFVGGPQEGQTIRRSPRFLPWRMVIRGGNRPSGEYDRARDPQSGRGGPYRAEYVLRREGDRLVYVHERTVRR